MWVAVLKETELDSLLAKGRFYYVLDGAHWRFAGGASVNSRPLVQWQRWGSKNASVALSK